MSEHTDGRSLPPMKGISLRGKIYVEEADCRATVNAVLSVKQVSIDELVKALRKTMEKLRVDSGCTDADLMAPFAFDAEWELIALENDALLTKYPEKS